MRFADDVTALRLYGDLVDAVDRSDPDAVHLAYRGGDVEILLGAR